MLTSMEPTKDTGELHPILSSMAIAFWRMRLLVERRAKTLPTKLLVLEMVTSEEGISPGEIRTRLGSEFSRVTRLIQSLEKEGLLLRKRDSEDRRFVHLYPTEKGREYLQERTQLINEELQERLEALNPDEVEELDRLLHIVAERVRM